MHHITQRHAQGTGMVPKCVVLHVLVDEQHELMFWLVQLVPGVKHQSHQSHPKRCEAWQPPYGQFHEHRGMPKECDTNRDTSARVAATLSKLRLVQTAKGLPSPRLMLASVSFGRRLVPETGTNHRCCGTCNRVNSSCQLAQCSKASR
jgi:hypothetical protein